MVLKWFLASMLEWLSLGAGEQQRWASDNKLVAKIMTINEFYASHIGRVAVSFNLSSPTLDPEEVTRVLNISPELVSIPPSTGGFWSLSSQGKIEGALEAKDINEHLRYLLSMLLPCEETILEFAKGGETYFDVLWESSYLYAGTGPLIASDCIAGICQLNAGSASTSIRSKARIKRRRLFLRTKPNKPCSCDNMLLK